MIGCARLMHLELHARALRCICTRPHAPHMRRAPLQGYQCRKVWPRLRRRWRIENEAALEIQRHFR